MEQLSRSRSFRETMTLPEMISAFVNDIPRVRCLGAAFFGDIFDRLVTTRSIERAKTILGKVLHMLQVMIEALILVVFGIFSTKIVNCWRLDFTELS